MSKFEELIQEYCPDGVEYKQIKEIAWTGIGLATSVTKYKKQSGTILLHNSDIKQNKIVIKNKEFLDENFVLMNSNKIHKYHDIITVHTGDVGTSAVIEEEYVGSIGFTTIMTRINNFNEVNPYYLSHYLNSNLFKKEVNKKSISDRNNLNQKDYELIFVPVPPLNVQDKIVRILDTFTELTEELTEELTAELEARKKQYEYYRDKILFPGQECEYIELGEVCKFVRGPFGGALKKEIFKLEGYAVYEQQHAIYQNLDFRYFVDEAKYKELKRFAVSSGDLIISCSGTIGKTFVIPNNAPEGIINQALLKLTPYDKLDVYYLQYFFENTISKLLNGVARGGAIKNVPSVNELKEIKIPLPSLEEQQRIVDILDRFDALCNDITLGLSAEIEARQKQYEYYRDKLLTFKLKN